MASPCNLSPGLLPHSSHDLGLKSTCCSKCFQSFSLSWVSSALTKYQTTDKTRHLHRELLIAVASWTSKAPAALSQAFKSTCQWSLSIRSNYVSPSSPLSFQNHPSSTLFQEARTNHLHTVFRRSSIQSIQFSGPNIASNQASRRPQASHAKFTAAEPKMRSVLHGPAVTVMDSDRL